MFGMPKEVAWFYAPFIHKEQRALSQSQERWETCVPPPCGCKLLWFCCPQIDNLSTQQRGPLLPRTELSVVLAFWYVPGIEEIKCQPTVWCPKMPPLWVGCIHGYGYSGESRSEVFLPVVTEPTNAAPIELHLNGCMAWNNQQVICKLEITLAVMRVSANVLGAAKFDRPKNSCTSQRKGWLEWQQMACLLMQLGYFFLSESNQTHLRIPTQPQKGELFGGGKVGLL